MDWGSLAYIGQDGRKHRIWVFVMTLGWFRAGYVDLVGRADTAAFIQCHVQRIRVPGRRAAALPLRQCQGGDRGTGQGQGQTQKRLA